MKVQRNVIAIFVLCLVLYLLAAFLLPFAHGAVFIIALVCTALAFALAAGSLVRLMRQQKLEGLLFHYPAARRVSLLLAAQTVLSLALMACGTFCPAVLAVALEAALLIPGMIWVLTTEASAQAVIASEEKQQDDTAPWKELRRQVRGLSAVAADPALRQKLLRLSDSFASADPRTRAEDDAITAHVAELKAQLDAGEADGAAKTAALLERLLQARR